MARDGIFHDPRRGGWRTDLSLGVDEATGKRRRKTFYGASAGEVRDKRTAFLADIAAGKAPTAPRLTLDAYLADWLEQAVRPRRDPSTYETHSRRVKDLIVPRLGHVQLARLTPDQIERFQNDLARAGKSGHTIRACLSVLRTALKRAQRHGLVARNVATLVEPLPVPRQPMAVLSADQARALLAATAGEWYGAAITLALLTGLRRGEVLGLRWQDVDLDAGSLTVAQQVIRLDNRAVIHAGAKNIGSERRIPLAPVAVAALHVHRREQLAWRMLTEVWGDHGLVFPTRRGTPTYPDNLGRVLNRMLTRAGLPHLALHALRHSCASLLNELGVDERTRMALLGHSRVQQALDYTHVQVAQQRAAVGRLDTLLGPVAGQMAVTAKADA